MPSHRTSFLLHNRMCSIILFIIFCNSFGKSETKSENEDDVDTTSSQRYTELTKTLIYPQIHQLNPNIVLRYHQDGELIDIDLKLNKDLLPDQHFLGYQNPNSKSRYLIGNVTIGENEFCHYQGSIKDEPNTRAAISTCNGNINGIIFSSNESFVIHAEKSGTSGSQHFLLRARNKNITSAGEDYSTREKRAIHDLELLYGPVKGNKRSLYVELVIVADNSVYKYFDEDLEKIHQYCKDVANIMSSLYAPLNIFIILTGVIVWNEKDEIVYDDDAARTLNRFLEYRRKVLSPEYPNDHAQLLTVRKFNNNVLGKAFVDPLCNHEYSGAVCMIHSPVKAIVANTMAHEMGHSFGMAHDGPECKCPDKKCIMSDTSASFVTFHWSSCSIESLSKAFARGITYCLRNKPTKVFSTPICGNSVVEPGEECDCGLPEFCKNKCCNPETCRLHANATCGSGECCDLKSCQLKKPGMVCRQTDNECDLREYCNGASEFCPKDVHKRNLEECDNGTGHCYDGYCGSHGTQCRVIWGNEAFNRESCYMLTNKRGDHAGNCGFDYQNNQFIKCDEKDIKCGKLQCGFPENRKNFGIESGAVTSIAYAYQKTKIVNCHSAIFKFGMHTIDPGLTPNGAKCGKDDACVGQKCIPKSQLLTEDWDKQCPDNCNGNGVCNNLGNCHCDIGFSGSSCRSPGPGGSIDSGPASNPSSYDAFKRFLYIFFCGVMPLVVGIFLCISSTRKNRIFKRKHLKKITNVSLAEVLCTSTSASNNSSLRIERINVRTRNGKQHEEPANSVDIVQQINSKETAANPPKVHKSIENVRKDFRKSFISKSSSNYELSTLSDSNVVEPSLNQKQKLPFKSTMNLGENSSRSKLLISDIRLQSSTNPLAVTLSQGVTLVGQSIVSNAAISTGDGDYVHSIDDEKQT